MKKYLITLAIVLFIWNINLIAQPSFLQGNGVWSNNSIWTFYPTEGSTAMIAIGGNYTVNLDGNYDYTSNFSQFYIGDFGDGKSGVLNIPANTSTTFNASTAFSFGGGILSGENATINITGGELWLLGQNVNVNTFANNPATTNIDISFGTLNIENNLVLNSANNTGHTYRIKIWNIGTLRANNIVKSNAGSANSYFTIDHSGRVIVSGDKTSDPSLGGIISAAGDGWLIADYYSSSDETIIFNGKTYTGFPIPTLGEWGFILLALLALILGVVFVRKLF